MATAAKGSGEEPICQIRAALASARRRESRLLRRLGRAAMESLSHGQGLSPEDGHIQLMVEDLRRLHGEIGCLLERLRQASASQFSDRTLYPPPPGSNTHFPFSR